MSEQTAPFPARLIRASAGTGKTFQLSNRLIALLAAGEEPQKILATTFTKKAAAEIRERVFCRIAQAARSDTHSKSLSAEIGTASFPASHYQSILAKLASEQHRISICTLDSFFVQIAKSFSLELGLPLEWDLLDESAVHEFNEEALRKVISDKRDRIVPLLQLFATRAHTKSVYNTFREDMHSNIRLYRETSYPQWNWLRSAGVLPANLREQLLEDLKNLELPLTKAGKPNANWKKAIDEAARLFRDSSWEEFLKKGPQAKILDGSMHYARGPIPDEIEEVLSPLVGHAGALVLRSLRRRTVAGYFLFKYLQRSLLSLKLSNRYFAFDDITGALSGTVAQENCAEIYYRLDSYLHHLLLDEFQDTSIEQWRILEPFAEEILSKSGLDHSFFCVGDVKQAIYGWRGGEAAIFDSLQQSYEPLSKAEELDASWRSAPTIIDAVNRVFLTLPDNDALAKYSETANSWHQGFREHRTERKDFGGHVQLRRLPEPEGEDTLELLAAKEVAALVSELQTVNPSQSIGVLLRQNKLVRPFIQSLREQGILASQEGGSPLSDNPTVSLFLSLLQLADHPSDTLAQFRLSHSAFATVFDLEFPTAEAAISDLSLRLRKELQSLGYGASILRWLGLIKDSLTEKEHAVVLQLVELAYLYQQRAGLRPRDFIRFVQRTRVEDPLNSRVTVMTVHKSKGLEFDSVILPELWQKLEGNALDDFIAERPGALAPVSRVSAYPNELCRALAPRLADLHHSYNSKKVHESLSLLYVALTRARHGLYASIPQAQIERPGGTFAGVLLAAFAPNAKSQDSQILFEQGDMRWPSTDESEPSVSESTPSQRRAIQLTARPKYRRRSLTRVTPSSGAHRSEDLSPASIQRKDKEALLRGSLIHRLFEEVEWIDDFSVGDASIASVFDGIPLAAEKRTEMLELFHNCLSSNEIQETLSRRSYDFGDESEIRREMAFAYREGNAVVNGSIDRLVLTSKGGKVVHAHIIDYKTDKVSASELAERSEEYRSQIEMYCTAVSRLFSLSRSEIRADLLFVMADARVEITPR